MYLLFLLFSFLFAIACFVFFILFLVFACTKHKYSVSLTLFLSFLVTAITCFILFIATAPKDDDHGKTIKVINETDISENVITVTPTISVTPVPSNIIQLSIVDVMLSEDLIGTPQIAISLKNSSDYDIDAFDIKVRCYNNYDELVRGYGVEDYYNGTSQDIVIKPGETKDSEGYWSLYGYDTATRFEVAIVKYHTTDGNTNEINNSDLIWLSVKK
ncbi:MAG: hypothetical protein K0R31_1869 [Clostridiales bacterium]|jgi:energy-coupling factor transporter transmembrane protein EcfT|nr:hypothetical protein [Clostridiales bacterium]